MLDARKLKFQIGLLKWIRKKKNNIFINYRKFPWRICKNPYKLLITEILLQKTTSKQVSEIWNKFFIKYPNFNEILKSDINTLKIILNPLGLQNEKSQRMIKIAKEVICEHNGCVPCDKTILLDFKGIGNYIANAVLCFGFGKKYEILDTNIIRIYQRIFGLKSEKKRLRTDKNIWQFAFDILPDKNYRLFNYALLDFGAEICKAKKPTCNLCLFNKICQYFLKSK